MRDEITGQAEAGQKRRRGFHLDGLLLVFLVVGWLLIFGSATLGLQRGVEEWLPVNLVPQVSADYGVDTAQALRLAPVRPQIVDAVKQDALAARPASTGTALAEVTPTSILKLIFRPTLTPTLTLVPTPLPTPLIVSAGGPYTGNEGSPVVLNANVAGPVSELISYRWDLDNNGLYDDAVGISTSVVFYDEGDYPISVQASDPNGGVASATTTVRVMNVAPIVDVGKDQYANEGKEVSFSGTVSDPGHDLLTYSWDFGDGTGTDETLHPRHTYADNGDYAVRLTAQDNDGGVTQASFFTHVGNLPPTASAGSDQASNEGDTVNFHGTGTDPGVLDSLTYAWDLDYDGVAFNPDSFGPDASTIYPDGPATIVAALRVQDKDGGQAIDTVNVTVGNVAPTILGVRNDGPVGEGSPMTLSVDAADVGADTLSYAFDWQNDGIFDDVNQPASVSHVWPDEGDYTVGVLVDDGDGGQVLAFTTVSAFNLPPTAVAGPAVARLEGSPVIFDGGGSTDPGAGDALTYRWNFGDGSPVATGTTVAHVYADNNVYTTTLTVTDDSGAADTDAVAVAILNANPSADAGLPDYPVDEGARLDLTGTASDPGTADVLSAAWDFDFDGVNFNEDATGLSVSPTFPDGPATYVIALRVRDDDYPYPAGGDGQIGEAIDTAQITVNNVPPVANARGPYRGHPGQPIRLSGTAVDVPADALTYQWDLDRNGTYDLTGATVITAWNTAGVYTVTLRVTDDDGGRGLDNARVTIINGLPTADAGGPYTGDEGRPIVLTGTGTDPDGDVLTYTWDLDGDAIFETPGQTVSHTWPDNGVYNVALRVEDGWGGVATDTTTVTVNNVDPRADAGGPYSGHPGQPVRLSGTAVDVPADTLVYEWDVNSDGVPDLTGQTVTYTWITSGTYTVNLRVTDDDGGQGSGVAQVDVLNRPPIVDAGGPYSGGVGQAITLTVVATDPDNDPLTYAWDLDSDTVFETPGQVVSYTWPSVGVYTVTVRVDDGWGGVATDIASVQVISAPIVLKIEDHYTTVIGTAMAHVGRDAIERTPGRVVYAVSMVQPDIQFTRQRRTNGRSL